MSTADAARGKIIKLYLFYINWEDFIVKLNVKLKKHLWNNFYVYIVL